MSDKPVRYCKICGNQLKTKQTRFCSNECFNKSRASTEKIYKCKVCGKDIRATGGKVRKYCSNACSFSDRKGPRLGKRKAFEAGKDRPFTSETAYLIRLWYKQGDSKERIAEALGRSLENIEQAFM